MRKTHQPTELAIATRARIEAFAKAHNLSSPELADLLGVPHGTVSKWTTDKAYAAFPRANKCAQLNEALDQLDASPAPTPINTPQLELSLDLPLSKPIKPLRDKTVQYLEYENRILLAGYRAGRIKDQSDEASYLLNHYRHKLLTKGE